MAIYKQSAFMEPSSMLLSRPNGHSRCSFLWHAMCIRPPLKLGHTEHRAHTLITSLISPIFFIPSMFSWKEFHQDLNHSYTNLPSPKKILWPRAELWTEKNELQLQLGKLGSNPYYHEMARFSDNNNFSTDYRDQRYKFFLLYCRAIAEDDLKTCFFNMQNIPL